MATYPTTNQSLLAQQTAPQNLCPQFSARLPTTTATSASVTFPSVTGTFRQTFKISNKGAFGAYIAWGKSAAVAVPSTGTPAANCDYVGSGAILVQDFQNTNGTAVDTIAAIGGADTQDAGATILEITVGAGQ